MFHLSLPTIIGVLASPLVAGIAYTVTYRRNAHRFFDKRHVRAASIDAFVITLAACVAMSVAVGVLVQAFD